MTAAIDKPASRNVQGRLLLAVALVMTTLSGCGGDDKKRPVAFGATGVADPSLSAGQTPPASAEQPAPTAGTAPTPAPEPTPESKPEGQSPPAEGTAKPEATAATPGQESDPAKAPERPADLSKWKRGDFLSARVAGDARLAEAIGDLGRRFPNDARAVQLLTDVLAPPKAAADPQAKSQPGNQAPPLDPKVSEAIILTLGANGTAEARKALALLLAGTLPSDDDRASVDIALRALAGNPSGENEAILLRVMIAPEQVRAQGTGQVAPEELRQKALALVQTSASPQFRLHLAQFLAAPTTPRALRDTVGKFLDENRLENVGAQMLMYQSEQLARDRRATLEGYFVAYSSETVARLLGLSTDAGMTDAATSPAPANTATAAIPAAKVGTADVELPYRTAQLLWTPASVAMIEKRLSLTDTLERQSLTLSLASTMPVDSARAAVKKVLDKRWEDGPQALETAGLTTNLVTDPAFLLTIKMLPRKDAKKDSTESGRSVTSSSPSPRSEPRRPKPTPKSNNPFGSGGSSSSTGSTSVEAARKSPEQLLQVQQDWMKTSTSLVQAWCERFYVAARASSLAEPTAVGSSEESPGGLPLVLPANSKVVAQYHRSWPGDDAAKLSGLTLSPLEIHYVRIEDQGDPMKAVGYYKRKLQAREYRVVDNGVWFDTMTVIPKTDRRRSLDVLITKVDAAAKPDAAGDSSSSEPASSETENIGYIVQILSIEAVDPTPGAKKAVVGSSVEASPGAKKPGVGPAAEPSAATQ